jgi:CO dehydrogenase maturation factor
MGKEEQSERLEKMSKENGLDLIGIIPEDDEITEFDLQGRPTIEINQQNPALKKAYEIFTLALNKS